MWNNATSLLPRVPPFWRNHPINEFSQAVLTLLQRGEMQRSAMQNTHLRESPEPTERDFSSELLCQNLVFDPFASN